MAKFTPRQRKALHDRLKQAICWREATAYGQSEASRMATTVIDAMEDAQFSAMALRRGVDAVMRSLADEEKVS